MNSRISTDMEKDPEVLQKSDPSKRETLETENPVDEMSAEQTFPSPEELQEAERENKVIRKKVPRGTSEYQVACTKPRAMREMSSSFCGSLSLDSMQAAWILDDEDTGTEDEDEEMDEDSDEDEFADTHQHLSAEEASESSEEEEDVEWLDTQSDVMSIAPDGAYDKNMDLKEDMEM